MEPSMAFASGLPGLRRSRPLRALTLATWFYSLLFVLYVAARRAGCGECYGLNDMFITGVPFFTILITWVLAFVIFVTSLVLYLALWWRTSWTEARS
jgi:hypothetical protein